MNLRLRVCVHCSVDFRTERRVALFVAASDESTDAKTTGTFFLGGWVARERLWDKAFAPDWQRRVLNGPPKIDHLHMVDIKNPKWCAERSITTQDAERRLDAAFDMIDAAGGLTPIVYSVDVQHFSKALENVKLVIKTEGGLARKKYQPDCAYFLHYVLQALRLVNDTYPDAHQVDFVVEENDQITKHLKRMHASIAKVLKALDAEELGRLVGDFIPGGKSRVPLQAADLLCWHAQAATAGTLSASDLSRYSRLEGRRGLRRQYTNDEVSEFARQAEDVVILDVGGRPLAVRLCRAVASKWFFGTARHAYDRGSEFAGRCRNLRQCAPGVLREKGSTAELPCCDSQARAGFPTSTSSTFSALRRSPRPLASTRSRSSAGVRPIDFGLAVRVHRLQVVDGVLDVVGLVRRLSRLLQEIRGPLRSAAAIAASSRGLAFLSSAEFVLDSVGLLASWLRAVSRNGLRVRGGLRPSRRQIDRPRPSESSRVASLAAKSSKCLSVSGVFLPTFTSDRS